MSKPGLRVKDVQVGDLVTHILYGDKWIGIIVGFKEEITSPTGNKKQKALVQIQPGTEYEGFFRRSVESDRVNENLGYVSIHWLFRIKEKNEKA
tara:strand:+ start:446 stop:727 length:282 start_codon:yes stop_codon:yes gene_type:complete